jgi:hypothetical protein
VILRGSRWAKRTKPSSAFWSFDRIIAATTAALSLAALAAVIFFGLYPRPPVEAPLDPDTFYRGGVAMGHVTSFDVEQAGVAEQYVLRVETSKPVEKGDVLRFRYATCIVNDLETPQHEMPNNTGLFNGITLSRGERLTPLG